MLGHVVTPERVLRPGCGALPESRPGAPSCREPPRAGARLPDGRAPPVDAPPVDAPPADAPHQLRASPGRAAKGWSVGTTSRPSGMSEIGMSLRFAHPKGMPMIERKSGMLVSR